MRVLRFGFTGLTGERTLGAPSGGSSNTTDDRGEYRAYGLPPGMYLVLATPGPPGRSGGPGIDDIRPLTSAELQQAMRAARAATKGDWRQREIIADGKGGMLVPQGRFRVIEKNGRERRLDDNLTAVRPVWSPNSAKIAIAFETQVRVYDAGGTAPPQAAIPLRNQLRISSQAYDREQQRAGQAANTNSDANAAPTATPGRPPQPPPHRRPPA